VNLRTIITLVLALLGTAIACAIVILVLAMSGLFPQLTERVDSYLSLGAPDVQAPPPSTLGPGGRLAIPSIEVDAPVIVVGKDASGVLETPDNGWDVGWYDFSTVPGQPGNAIMTGHVDYYDIGPAVFWRLRDLGPGDEVQVHLPEGDVVVYQVTRVDSYDAGTAPVEAIMGPTTDDVLTLITCTGSFNPSIREYDHRLVVRAERAS
jgi:LPXTG-site transpeptidase (sortase) family protein